MIYSKLHVFALRITLATHRLSDQFFFQIEDEAVYTAFKIHISIIVYYSTSEFMQLRHCGACKG